jgi:Holliday junction resolvase RusA-like endonuclease
MQSVSINVPGDPVQWARAGRNGKFSFTPHKQAVHMDTIRIEASRAFKGDPLNGPLELRVRFVYEWPKSWSAKKRGLTGNHWKISKPDADNLIKLIGDSLNKILWHDDAQICQTSFSKQYGLTSATHITVEQLVAA